MSDVPPDVFPDILSRLPVMSLLRFRCVCKAWRRIIDDQSFIKLHLHHQSDCGQLILKNRKGSKLYTLSLDSLSYSCTPTKIIVEASPLMTWTRNGVSVPRTAPFPAPSCNGLILIENSFGDVSMVWNPFTREAHELPPHIYPLSNQVRGHTTIGLGYDSVSDDYKVVKIVDSISRRGTWVYSLKLKSWRIVKDCPSSYVPFMWDPGVFVNGALHWLTAMRGEGEEKKRSIITFDVVTEDYHLLPFPSVLSNLQGHSLRPFLDALGESLLLTWCESVYRLDGYGGENSWAALFSFSGMGLWDARAIAYFKSRDEVLLWSEVRKYFCFNIKEKSAKKVTIDCAPGCWSSQICMGSLVRLSNSYGSAKGISGRKKKRANGSLKIVLTTTDVRNVPDIH